MSDQSQRKSSRSKATTLIFESTTLDPYLRAFYILLSLLLITWIVSTCGKTDTPPTINHQTPADIALDKAKNLGANVVETLKDIASQDASKLDISEYGDITNMSNEPINGQSKSGPLDIQTLLSERPDLPPEQTIRLGSGNPIDRVVNFLQDASVEAPQTFMLRGLEFESGSRRLTAGSTAAIDALASVIKAYSNVDIRLDGHTDNTGDPGKNKALSGERANAVMQALIKAGGDAKRISAQGFGDERPIASNQTPQGQHANRRVEVVVLNK